MVRSGASSFACVAIAMLSFALFPSGVGETAESHAYRFATPGSGTLIRFDFDTPYNDSIEYLFTGTGDALAGHFERRQVALADVTYGSDHWNHTRSRAFDLKTGLLLGSTHSRAEVYGLPFGDMGPLWQRFQSESTFGDGIRADYFLPETLLWGRSVWHAQSWTVETLEPYCEDAEIAARLAMDWNGTAYANITAFVDRSCTTSYGVGHSNWTLEFGDQFGLLANNRTVRTTFTNLDGDTWSNVRVIDAKLVEEGGEYRFGFEGRADVPFWAPRDQSMRYGTGDMFPADPEPHPLFDIREAGEAALALDDEEVRLFLARAENATLASARLHSQFAPQVSWSFTFIDDHGRRLYVDLDGYKIGGLPLIVEDGSAHTTDGSSWWEPPAAEETAYVGDLARRTDVFFAAQDRTPTAYEWEHDHFTHAPRFTASASGRGTLPTVTESQDVHVDAETGIVLGERWWRSSIGL